MQTFELEKTKQDKKQHTIIIIMPKNNCCHTMFCFDEIKDTFYWRQTILFNMKLPFLQIYNERYQMNFVAFNLPLI